MFREIVWMYLFNNLIFSNGHQVGQISRVNNKWWASTKGNTVDDESWLNEVVKPIKPKKFPSKTSTTFDKLPGARATPTTTERPKKIVSENIDWTEPGNFVFNLTVPSIYNRLVAPGQLDGLPTTIELGFYVESLSTFRVQTMDFEVDIYLLLAWNDSRLEHEHDYPILINDKLIAKRIWRPDIYFVNSKLAYIQDVTRPNFSIYIYNDGYVITSIRVSSTMACKLNLRKFPMDVQKCSVVLQSFGFVRNVLNLTWHHGNGYPVMWNENLRINDMDIINVTTGQCDDSLPLTRNTGLWSCVSATIEMHRKLEFHVFQSFFPLGMLVVVSWLSFWIDYKVAAARVGLIITSLLTLTTISNASRSDFPNIPYMKANDLWAVVCQLFVFCVLLEYTLLNLRLNSPYSKNCPVHSKKASSDGQEFDPLLVSSSSKTCKICEKYLQKNARNVDEISKILFPSAFALFVILYLIYVIFT